MIRKFENYLNIELKDSGLTFGDNVNISNDVILHNPQNISIGNNVRIDSHCILIAGKDSKITIGSNVHIAAGCYFFGGSANIILEDYAGTSSNVVIYTGSDDYTQGYMTNPMVDDAFRKVTIGDVILRKHVVVGSGTIILPNIVLAFATSVGANSLITKSTNEFDCIFGNPAKFYKKRKNVYLS
jgi:galactoside O-acetyltransferase